MKKGRHEYEVLSGRLFKINRINSSLNEDMSKQTLVQKDSIYL